LTVAEVETAVSLFDSMELAVALRQGWFPIGGVGIASACAVTDRQAEIACRNSGRNPVVRVDRQVLIDAISANHARNIADKAANALARKSPHFSANRVLTIWQGVFGCLLLIALLAFAWHFPGILKTLLTTVFSVLFIGISCLKFASVFVHGKARLPDKVELRDDELPVYTVLVPLFQETSILRQTVAGLKSLNYPADKLDVKIIVEQDDFDTREMVRHMVPGTGFDIITVPRGKPQTKPRALNHALMFARGDLVTIYDAEDIPQPMQLRLAAQSFRNGDAKLACLQARLSFYNSNENWLTR
jgi:hypothetical protein